MEEHKHILNLLKEAKKAARNNDVYRLRDLSNETVHSAALYRESESVLVAILIYALSKLIERRGNFDQKYFVKYYDFYLNTIDELIEYILVGNEKQFQNKVNDLLSVKGLSEDLKNSINDVFRKARINKANKIYEHGISMESTAKLLGISIWELAEYSGQTNVADSDLSKTIDVKKRIKNLTEFFS